MTLILDYIEMTDPMLKALQAHVAEKEPITNEELITKLMWRCDMLDHNIKVQEQSKATLAYDVGQLEIVCDNQAAEIVSLNLRIEELEKDSERFSPKKIVDAWESAHKANKPDERCVAIYTWNDEDGKIHQRMISADEFYVNPEDLPHS